MSATRSQDSRRATSRPPACSRPASSCRRNRRRRDHPDRAITSPIPPDVGVLHGVDEPADVEDRRMRDTGPGPAVGRGPDRRPGLGRGEVLQARHPVAPVLAHHDERPAVPGHRVDRGSVRPRSAERDALPRRPVRREPGRRPGGPVVPHTRSQRSPACPRRHRTSRSPGRSSGSTAPMSVASDAGARSQVRPSVDWSRRPLAASGPRRCSRDRPRRTPGRRPSRPRCGRPGDPTTTGTVAWVQV